MRHLLSQPGHPDKMSKHKNILDDNTIIEGFLAKGLLYPRGANPDKGVERATFFW
jgi:hypothetical protein